MQTKTSTPLSADRFSYAIRDAGLPSTSLPIQLDIEAPYAAGTYPAEIYAREDDPHDFHRYLLRARFVSQDPVEVVGGAAQLEREFTIEVNLHENRCEATYGVNPPPRHS